MTYDFENYRWLHDVLGQSLVALWMINFAMIDPLHLIAFVPDMLNE
jgi:hypothetical protein